MDTVAIIGMGNVGAACAYAMMIGGVAARYVLADIDEAKRHAHALDLRHGQQFAPPCQIVEGGLDAAAGCDIAVITAGAKQRPGETRLDLAARNSAIVREIVPAVLEKSPGAIVLMVSNPVDVLTMQAAHLAERRGTPRERIIGSGTVLDSSRLRRLLADRLGAAVGDVNALIVGEHGDSSIALWSSATVGSCPLRSFRPAGAPPLSDDDLQAVFRNVVNAAYEIIRGKGATSLAIGLAVARICSAILRNEHAVLPVSSLFDRFGEALDQPVACSVPTVVGRAGVTRIVHEQPLSPDELGRLRASAAIIRKAYQGIA
ncbi:MAG: L-lactate dehydrogenase [Phycisphaerales bacterium]|nr:L-lactate dehydrogenase [Phycisphaerales bacterium]